MLLLFLGITFGQEVPYLAKNIIDPSPAFGTHWILSDDIDLDGNLDM